MKKEIQSLGLGVAVAYVFGFAIQPINAQSFQTEIVSMAVGLEQPLSSQGLVLATFTAVHPDGVEFYSLEQVNGGGLHVWILGASATGNYKATMPAVYLDSTANGGHLFMTPWHLIVVMSDGDWVVSPRTIFDFSTFQF